MQRTRLSTLFDTLGSQLNRWLINPWRRLSIVIISLLGGNFFGVALATISGQAAEQDVVAAAIVVALAEGISRFVYGRRDRNLNFPEARTPLIYEALNAIKIGALYALVVEAFKLGS
ncbi:MAG TPA: DUF565 domain-containing protein [Leptolyngbyaceae cyanobacterium]